MMWIIPLLFLASCAGEIDYVLKREQKNRQGKAAVTVLSQEFNQDVSQGLDLKIRVNDKKLSLGELRKRLLLLKDPPSEQMPLPHLPSRTIAIKISKRGEDFKLFAPKKAFEHGCYYGLFWRDPKKQRAALLYTLRALPARPQLISHDVGVAPQMVNSKRIYFRFSFDQAMHLHSDDALRVIALSQPNSTISIDRLSLSPDGHTLVAKLSMNGDEVFIDGHRYAFIFSETLKNVWGVKAVVEPVEFTAKKEPIDLVEKSVLSVSSSDRSAEFSWRLSNYHKTEVYLVDSRGVRESLDRASATAAQSDKDLAFFSKVLVKGLPADRKLQFFVKSEDLQGQVLIASGAFNTAKKTALRISEIMIDPKQSADHQEQSVEFIELINDGLDDISLENLSISIADPVSDKENSCQFDMPYDLKAKAGARVLLVARDFFEEFYGVAKDALILRLDRKTLCGGLPNHQRRVIKIHWHDGNYIDRYGGYLWETAEGQSVQRIAPSGEDEPSNYCLSSLKAGPTPGATNGPCERFDEGGAR